MKINRAKQISYKRTVSGPSQASVQHCSPESGKEAGPQIFLQSAEIKANVEGRGGKQEILQMLALPLSALYSQSKVIKTTHTSLLSEKCVAILAAGRKKKYSIENIKKKSL